VADSAIVWQAPDGFLLDLMEPTKRHVTPGRLGAFMPPVSHIEDTVPLQPGSRLRGVQVRPREIALPLFVTAATAALLRAELRGLLHYFDPARGDGILRATTPSGEVRELTCRYAGGLEGDEGEDASGLHWMDVVLTFRAHDPYWYSPDPIQQSFGVGSGVAFFPIFPLRLAPSTIFTDVAVNNTGDVEGWPTWVITGPGSNIVLRNLTTDQALTLATSLAGGETATIDTRPFVKTVTGPTGNNLFSAVAATSQLWPFQPGVNTIRVEMTGATPASSVRLALYPRFRSI
jgi:hypothetical protein